MYKTLKHSIDPSFQVKQFKTSVDELSVEIGNNSEMYDFVRLKKEIYAAFLDLSRSVF
jgi:hypothetical protein